MNLEGVSYGHRQFGKSYVEVCLVAAGTTMAGIAARELMMNMWNRKIQKKFLNMKET